MEKERITGIILCGGQSSRLGSDKGLFKIGNKTLAERAIEILAGSCETILLSTNNLNYSQFGFPMIPDIFPGSGPMAGIYSCLQVSRTEHHWVLSVDTPLVTSDLLRFMFLARENAWIVVPEESKGKYEPLIGYYNSKVRLKVLDFLKSGNCKLPALFEEVPFKGIEVKKSFPGYHPALFQNLNVPEDLDQILPWIQQE